MIQPKKGGKGNIVPATQYDSQFESSDFTLQDPSTKTLDLFDTGEGQKGLISRKKEKELTKGGVNYYPGTNIQKQLAAHQSGSEQAWRALKRGAVGAAVAVVEPFAYVLDFEHHWETLKGTEEGYDNWLTKSLRNVEDHMRETNPIYTRTNEPELMSAEWWAKNADQMIRSIGYLAGGSVMFKAGSMGAKLALTKAANLMGKSVSGLQGATNIIGAVSSATALNYGEHAVSAAKHIEDNFPRLLQHYTGQGMDPGQAEERAKKELYQQASDIVVGGKANIIWQSMSQLNLFRGIAHTRSMGRMSTSAKAPGVKVLLRKLGIEMPTEALEEITTGYLEAEARHKVDIELGLRLEDHRPTYEKWIDHASSYEGMTEGLTGAFGAVGMSTVTAGGDIKQRINAIKKLKETEAALGKDGYKVKDLTEQQFFQHAILNAYNGTFLNFKDMLEGYKNMSAEEAAKLGVEEGYKELADQYLKDAEAIEETFNSLIQDPMSKAPGALEVLLNNKVNRYRNEKKLREFKKEVDNLKAEIATLNENINNKPGEVGLHNIKDLELSINVFESLLENAEKELSNFKKSVNTSPLLASLESNEREGNLKSYIESVKKQLEAHKKSKQSALEREALTKDTTVEEIIKSLEGIQGLSELDMKLKHATMYLEDARERRKASAEEYEVYVKNPKRLEAEGKKLVEEQEKKAAQKKKDTEKSKTDKDASTVSKIVKAAKKTFTKKESKITSEAEKGIIEKINRTATLEGLATLKAQLDADNKTSEAVQDALKARKTVLGLGSTTQRTPKGDIIISNGKADTIESSIIEWANTTEGSLEEQTAEESATKFVLEFKKRQRKLAEERGVNVEKIIEEQTGKYMADSIAQGLNLYTAVVKKLKELGKKTNKLPDTTPILSGSQQETSDRLDAVSDMISLQEEEGTTNSWYTISLPSGEIQAIRTSSALKEAFPKDAFTGASHDINTEWGNLVDKAIEAIIAEVEVPSTPVVGHNKTEEIKAEMTKVAKEAIDAHLNSDRLKADVNITPEAIKSIVDAIFSLQRTNPKTIFKTQIKSFKTASGKTVAGALDIVAINEDGKVTIIDIKTSKDSSQLAAYAEGQSGYTSKKTKHARQQSLYKNFLEAHGIEVEGISILPFHIQDDGAYIKELTTEPLIELTYLEGAVNAVFKPTKADEPHLSPELNGDITNESTNTEEISNVNATNANQAPVTNSEIFEKGMEGKSKQLKSSQSAGFLSIDTYEIKEDWMETPARPSKSNSYIPTNAHVHSTRVLRDGSVVTLKLIKSTDVLYSEEELRNMSEEQIANAAVAVYAIVNGTPTKVTALHSMEWVSNNNAESTVNAEVAKAKEIRKHLASEGGSLTTSVMFKGSGLFLQLFEEDANGDLVLDSNNKPISRNIPMKDALPDWANIEIGIVKAGAIKVKGATTSKQLSADIVIGDGRVVALLPAPNGTFFPAILWADNVSEVHANTIIGAAVSYIMNDEVTFSLIKDKTGIDFGRDGAKPALNAFINRYVYASPYSYKLEEGKEEKQNQVFVYASSKMGSQLQIVDIDNRTVYTNDPKYYFENSEELSPDEDGVYSGELKQEHKDNNILVVKSLMSEAAAAEASTLLQRKLISVNQNHLNREGNFTDVELSIKGEVVLTENGEPKTTTHPSYNSFKANSLKTDINGHNKITHTDGTIEHTYMTQPVVLFDFSAVEEEASEKDLGRAGGSEAVHFSLEFEEEMVEKTDLEHLISDEMNEELVEGLINPSQMSLKVQEDFLQALLPVYASDIVLGGMSFADVSNNMKAKLTGAVAKYKSKGSYKLKAFTALLENYTHVKGKVTVEGLILERLKELDIIPTSKGFEASTLSKEEMDSLMESSSDFVQDAYDVEFYKADRKKTVSAEVKLFLASITDERNKNWAGMSMGLRYQEVYDTLKSMLTNVKGGFAAKVEALREASPSPVYKTVLKAVENLPLDFKHKFTIAMSGTELGFVQVLVDVNNSSKTQVVNADNYSVIENTMEKWLNHLKTSALVQEVQGETVINNKKVLEVSTRYAAIFAKANQARKDGIKELDLQSDRFLLGLQGVLRELGMDIPIGGLKYLATTTNKNRGRYINNGTWEANLNPAKNFLMSNLLGAFQKTNGELNSAMWFLREGKGKAKKELVEEITTLAHERINNPDNKGLFYVNNPIEGGNSEWVVKGLARLTVDYNGVVYGNSLRGADGKSIYPFQNEFGMQRLLDQYKNDPRAEHNSLVDLLKLSVSNGSVWGEKIVNGDENFSLEVKMFDATKMLKSSQAPKERKNQGKFSQSITSLVLFTNKGLETGYFFPLTLSDKDITPLLKATKWKTVNGDTALSQMIIEDGKIVGIKDTLLDVLTEYAMGEYNRAYYHQTEGKQKALEAKVDRGAYETGANYFYKFEYLNSYNGENSEIWEADGRTLKIGLDKNKVKDFIKSKLEAHTVNAINEHIEDYASLNVTDKYINNSYTAKATKELSDAIEKNHDNLFAAAIADMNLNYIIAFNEQHILFGNDQAHAWKENKGAFNLKASIKLSINNYTKRKADLLSPRTAPEYSKKTANIVTVKDSKKTIDGKSIERTDAQEYGTILEALEMKFPHGKIPEAIYNKIKAGVEAAIADKTNINNYYELSNFLDPVEVRAVEEIFVTDKPVHVANDINVELDSNNKVFRKSSTRWLWPNETRGLDLDGLRIALENLGVDRLGHQSSDKVGAINVATIYNAAGELLSQEEITRNLSNIDHATHIEGEAPRSAIRAISRDGLGWQQEKPTNKTTVAQSTQMDVLVFEDMLDVMLSSGRTVLELRTEKEEIVSEFYKEGVKSLFKRMGVKHEEGVVTDINVEKVSKFLEAEARSRGWAKKDIAELQTKVIDEVSLGEKVFKSPLMYNHARKNIDSLVLSLIRKEVANIKMPGYGYIQASNVGFRSKGGLSWSEYSNSEERTEVEKSIILVNAEENENAFDETIGLQGPRISPTTGKVIPGQILVSPYFKIDGKTIDLTSKKYTKKDQRTGKRYLQLNKIPKELLEMIAYRIPGQGKPSVMPVEVVGFLPKTSIATVIIPDEMIAQMGSDFDIDVLYTYRKHYIVDDEGEIKKKTDLNPLEKLQDRYYNVMKELIFDPSFVNSTEALDNNDLKNAAALVNKLVGKEYEIKSPIYLKDNIENNIDQRTGKMLIAPSSLSATLFASMQGRGIQVSPDSENNPIPFEFFSVIDRIDKEDVRIDLALDNISAIGRTKGHDSGIERTSGENNRSVQNAAVDNANEQVLADAGINNATIDVALFALGYKTSQGRAIHTEQLVYFLRQEAIEIYNKQFDYWESNAEGGYLSFEQIREKAFDGAMHELESRIYPDMEAKEYSKMDISEFRKDVGGDFKTFSSQDFKNLFGADKSSAVYIEDQMAILAGFRKLQINADPVKKLQRAIMSPRTKALKSTIFDAEATLSVMQEVFTGELRGLIGVEDALKGTQFEALYTNLRNAYESFGKIMPFNIASHKEVLELYKEDHGGASPSPAIREHLFNALLEKGYARAFETVFEESIEDYRNLTLFSMEKSLSLEIQNIQATEWGKRNLFLQRLIPILKSDFATPNTVGYTASKQEDVVDQMHKDLISLYQSDIKGHRELFEKIVKYAYAVGGIKNARSFVQFIPSAYLDRIGFYTALRAEERSAKEGEVEVEEVYKEWLQHNPFYTTSIAKEDLTLNQFLAEPMGDHSVVHKGKTQPYQIVLKSIDKAKHNLPFHKYTYVRDGIERYRNVLSIKVGNSFQLYEKVITARGVLKMDDGVVFKRIPLKGKNTPKYRVSEYSGIYNETVGTIFMENEAPTTDFTTQEGEFTITPDVPTLTVPEPSKEDGKYVLSYGMEVGREGARKMLEEVVLKSDSEQYRVLAKVLLSGFDTLGSHIQGLIEGKTIERAGKTLKVRGAWIPKTNKLQLNKDSLDTPRKFEEVILHEFLHGYLTEELNNTEGSLYIAMNRLRNVSITALKKKMKEVPSLEDALLEYAFSNVHEFMTHALTNATTQRFLNEVNATEDPTKSVWGRIKRAVAHFINTLAKSLGITVNEQGVLVEAIYTVMEEVSEETAAEKTAAKAQARVQSMTTMNELLGVIQENGMFDLKHSMIMSTSKANERVAKGQYTKEQVENAIKLTTEYKAKISDPLASIAVSDNVDTAEQFINTITERINKLRTKLTTKNLTEVEGQKIRERLKIYERQRKSIRDDKTLAKIRQVAENQFGWVKRVIKNKNATNIEFQESLNIVDSYDYNVTSEFLEAHNLTDNNVWNKAILDMGRTAGMLKAKLLDTLREDIFKEIQEKLPDLRVTLQDLKEIPEEDFMALKAYTQDLTKFKAPLVKLINRSLKLSARAAERATGKLFENIDAKWAKVADHPAVKADPHLFFQKDKDGNPSGYFISSYSNSWRLDRNKAFKTYYKAMENLDKTSAATPQAKTMQSNARKQLNSKLLRDLNNIEIAIDIRYWKDDAGNDQSTFLNADSKLKDREAYIAFLDNELGESTRKDLVNKAIEKFEQYQGERDANIAILMQDTSAGEVEINARIKAWTDQNSPIIALNARYGSQQNTGKQYGHRRLTTAPRKSHRVSGKSLKYYDPAFTAIQNDPQLMEFYEFYVETMQTLMKVLPDNVVENLPENFWPAASRSFMEDIQKKGVFGTFKIFSKEGIMSYFTVDGKTQLSPIEESSSRSVDTGEVLKTVPIRMIKGVEAEDKSYDISRVMKMFAAMSKNFEFKSAVEDRVLLLQRVLNEARELEMDANGNPTKLSKGRGNLSIKGGLSVTREAVDYAIDASLHGAATDTEKGILLKAEAIKIQDQLKVLEEKYANGNIDKSKYNAEKSALEKIFKEIDPKRLGIKKALDNLIAYTQVKGMGYNVTAGINNLGFGTIANYVHAAGGEDFTTAGLSTAYAMVMGSSANAVRQTTKIGHLVNLYGILFDQLDTQYGKESRNKGWTRHINPFLFQTKTEFINQAAPFVAMMRETKVDDKGTSLFDIYNDEGGIKEEFSHLAKDWSTDLEADTENKFTDFRDHIIELNKINHGNYDPNSYILLKKSVYGRLAIMFRTWALEGFNTRFAASDYNDQLKRMTEGRYQSYKALGVGGAVQFLGKGILNSTPLSIFSEESMKGELTDLQYTNMKKNLSEFKFFIAVYSLMLMFKSLAADDDDEKNAVEKAILSVLSKEMAQLGANISLRLVDDFKFYLLNPSTIAKILKNPTAAMKTISDVGKAVDSSIKYLREGDEYQGDPLIKKWSKAVPGGSAYYSYRYLTEEVLTN